MNRKKKILFLEQYSNVSGGQRVLLQILKKFPKRDYELITVVPQQGPLSDELDSLGVRYVILASGFYKISRKTWQDIIRYMWRLPFLVIRLLHLIEQERIDLVYANGARTFAWATVASALTKIPIIWHLHSIFKKGIPRVLCLFFGRWRIVRPDALQSEGAPDR